jgi:acetyl esterase
MPLDPQVEALMKQMVAAGGPALETLSPADARAFASKTFGTLAGPVEEVGKVEDRKIPGPAGQIPVRVYTPTGAGPFPLLVFYHGGGWVIGDLDTHDNACRQLTRGARCVTVAVDYRLAPENKFPAAAEDCYAATLWAAEHARELGADASRIAVGGDSAGGNLSAVVSIMARDQGKPAIKFQLLIYPATDGALDTYSHQTFKEYFLTDKAVQYFWGHYVRSAADKKDPLASPALARSHAGLPPALIITAEFDPLRDEGEAYGEKLRAAGVPVTVTRYDGMIHGFFTMTGVLDQGKKAVEQASEALRKAFSK